MHIDKDENGNYIIPPIAGKKVFFFTNDKDSPMRSGTAISNSYEECVEAGVVKHYFYTKIEGYPSIDSPRNVELKHIELTEEALKTTLKLAVDELTAMPV